MPINKQKIVNFSQSINEDAYSLVGDAACANELKSLNDAIKDLQHASNRLLEMATIVQIVAYGKQDAEQHLAKIHQFFNQENGYTLVHTAVLRDDVETLEWLVNGLGFPLAPLNYDWKKDCEQQKPNEFCDERDQGFSCHTEPYSVGTYADQHFNYKSAFLLAVDRGCPKVLEWILASQSISDSEYYRAIRISSSREAIIFNILFDHVLKRDDEKLFGEFYRNYFPKIDIEDVAKKLNHNKDSKIVKWIENYLAKIEPMHHKQVREAERKRKTKQASQQGLFAKNDVVVVTDSEGFQYEAQIKKRVKS